MKKKPKSYAAQLFKIALMNDFVSYYRSVLADWKGGPTLLFPSFLWEIAVYTIMETNSYCNIHRCVWFPQIPNQKSFSKVPCTLRQRRANAGEMPRDSVITCRALEETHGSAGVIMCTMPFSSTSWLECKFEATELGVWRLPGSAGLQHLCPMQMHWGWVLAFHQVNMHESLLEAHNTKEKYLASFKGLPCHGIVNFAGQGFCIQAGSFRWEIQTLINTVQVMSACNTRFKDGTPFWSLVSPGMPKEFHHYFVWSRWKRIENGMAVPLSDS